MKFIKYLAPIISATVIILVFVSSCKWDYLEPIDSGPAPTGVTGTTGTTAATGPNCPDTISFALDVQPIFDFECINCHPGSQQPDLTAGNSYNALINGGYVNVSKPKSSILYSMIVGDMNSHLPDPANDRVTIYCWIEQGALDN